MLTNIGIFLAFVFRSAALFYVFRVINFVFSCFFQVSFLLDRRFLLVLET
jgi:predicted tellurium resistance membrane protein TerC